MEVIYGGKSKNRSIKYQDHNLSNYQRLDYFIYQVLVFYQVQLGL